MRTTLNISDELYRAVRVRAATDGRTVTALVEQALRSMLAEDVQLPTPFTLRTLPVRPEDENDAPAPPYERNDNSAMLDYFDELSRRSDEGS
jgi:plasmid stability protein